MKCPVCGNYSPDSMTQCQFCSTPFPTAQPAQPVQLAQPAQPMQTVPQQQFAVPQNPAYAQPMQTGAPVAPAQPAYQNMPYPYGSAPARFTGMPAPAQQGQFGAPQMPTGIPQQQYAAPQPQPQYAAPQMQYAAPQAQYSAPQTPAVTPAASMEQQQYAPASDASAYSPAEEQPSVTEAEPAEVDEKTASKGTVIALLTWFAVLGVLLACVYFNLPSKATELFASLRGQEVASESDAVPPTEEELTVVDDAPVLDALYGTWVLCSYNVQNLTDNSIVGGAHSMHETPLQFYTFNSGELDRFAGKTSSELTHITQSYNYTNSIYSGSIIEGGSSAPVVVLDDTYMCVYDYLDVDGVSSYVEYALLRVFDEPASDEALRVYAEAIESGGVTLPVYSSTVMVGGDTVTTTTTATVSATYSLMGTWLLTSREYSENELVESIVDGTLDYIYNVFSYDGSYITHTLVFDEAMEECLSRDSESGMFDFGDGLLRLKHQSGIAVTSFDGGMYFDYIDDEKGHIHETYKFIVSDEFSSAQLAELRPELD